MSAKAVAFVVAGIAAIALSHSATVAFQAKPASIWDGVYTEEQAKRAAPLYTEKCANCHGAELTGNDAPALVGAEFSANWSDLTLADLSERIRLTMPADSPGSMTRAQTSDLIALMLKQAEVPAGKAELPAAADALKQIKYVGSKPSTTTSTTTSGTTTTPSTTTTPATTTPPNP